MKKLTIIAAALALTACVSPKQADRDATRALEAYAFTDIHLEYKWGFECARGDTWARGFTAINPSGHYVTGTVCGAWMKGATVRF